MNKLYLTILVTSLTVLSLSGCNSVPETNASKMGMNIPSWVTNPTTEKGLIASSCVVASTNFSMDKKQATISARLELGNQLNTRITSLQEEYSSKVSTDDNVNINTAFDVTTVQLTDQAIVGSKVKKIDYAQISSQNNLCALVTLSEKNTQELFSKIMKKAPITLSPENETLLYLNFSKSENRPFKGLSVE